MSLRNRLVVPIILSMLAVLAGCSSNSSNPATPPPSGNFSNSSFNGTYAFSAAGTGSSGAFFALAGTLQANGSGSITGGTLDLNDASSSTPLTNVAITGGTYSVTSDGRGQATLNTAQGPVRLDFVLLSSSHAMVTRYDTNGTGGGSMDLQKSVTQAQLAGSYAFNLGGIDVNGNSLATVGSFTLDSSGNISSGVEDFNDAGNASTALTLTGSVTVGTGTAPGAATLIATNSSSATPFGTLTFDVYTVDATHFKFVEKDTAALLGGDAFTQQGAALPSTSTVLAYTMAGGITTPLSVGGFMTVDGVSAVSNGLEDVNNNGIVPAAPLSFTGTYAASGSVGGRTLFTLSGFSGATQLVAYPTASAGVQLLEIDNSGLLSGVAFEQTSGASLASSQGYGLGVTGINIGGLNGSFEEDDIAEFTTTSTGFSGLIDINDEGTLSFDQKFTGNYAADSPATGRGVLTSNLVNGVYYAVDSSTALFLETDTNQVGSGSLLLQTPGAKSSAAAAHMIVLPVTPAAHGNFKRK
jgi:hypothetical protein